MDRAADWQRRQCAGGWTTTGWAPPQRCAPSWPASLRRLAAVIETTRAGPPAAGRRAVRAWCSVAAGAGRHAAGGLHRAGRRRDRRSAATCCRSCRFETLTIAGAVAQLMVALPARRAAGPRSSPSALPLPFSVAGAWPVRSVPGIAQARPCGLAALVPAFGAGRCCGSTAGRGQGAHARPARSSRDPAGAHARAGNGPGSPGSCTTWSPTTSR